MEQGEATLGNCALRVDLVGPVHLGQRWCTRAGFITDLARVLVGHLHFVPLICEELP